MIEFMVQYIDKDVLVAEINNWIKDARRRYTMSLVQFSLSDIIELLESLLSFLNTLEAKEFDLEKELENLIEKEKAFVTDNREVKYYNGDSFNHIYELEFIAKHFFELGLAQK